MMTRLGRHGIDFLKAISQAFFFDDAYFGGLLLLALFGFDARLGVMAVIPALTGYVHSVGVRTPKSLKASGLLPINGFFFGLALGSLFTPSKLVLGCLALGSLALPMAVKAAHEVLQHWKLSPIVFPYILAVWAISLCGQGAANGLQTHELYSRMEVLPAVSAQFAPFAAVLASALESVGRLLFLPDPRFGLICLVLVTLFAPRRGYFFLLGTLSATLAALLLADATPSWQHGALTYNAGLIGLGLGAFPEKFRTVTIMLFCSVSALFTIALEPLLARQELPLLSLPYVVTLWFAWLSRVPKVDLSWAEPAPETWKPLREVVARSSPQIKAPEKAA